MKNETHTAYPLQWPVGWKRTPPGWRKKSKFGSHPFGRLRQDLFRILSIMRARSVVLSTNIPLRQDGMPYATFKTPEDTGVAVYFFFKNRQMVIACDTWRSIEENLQAVCKSLDAIRGIERWGASEMLERAFDGFAQLEAPVGTVKREWWQVLGLSSKPTYISPEDLKAHYRSKAKVCHPDMPGGSTQAMQELNEALDAGLRSPTCF